jgi:mannose-6-phosphate isomerase-like protein (cupin superfamily)
LKCRAKFNRRCAANYRESQVSKKATLLTGALMMKKQILIGLLLLLAFSSGAALVFAVKRAPITDGYLLERDGEVAKNEPGPHDGGGPSTGYLFFEKAPDLKFSFRKRVLHKGAAIGYHLQKTDEVYYFTGGEGVMTINGKPVPVKPGDAVLTRGGSSHGLVQKGESDLTIVITFQKE